MTSAELLVPRYEVIEDFPRSGYNIGAILTPITKRNKIFECINSPSSETIYNPEKYPHLFRKMAWWENRDIEDMPKYVMFHNKTIYKINYWDISSFKGILEEKKQIYISNYI